MWRNDWSGRANTFRCAARGTCAAPGPPTRQRPRRKGFAPRTRWLAGPRGSRRESKSPDRLCFFRSIRAHQTPARQGLATMFLERMMRKRFAVALRPRFAPHFASKNASPRLPAAHPSAARSSSSPPAAPPATRPLAVNAESVSPLTLGRAPSPQRPRPPAQPPRQEGLCAAQRTGPQALGELSGTKRGHRADISSLQSRETWPPVARGRGKQGEGWVPRGCEGCQGSACRLSGSGRAGGQEGRGTSGELGCRRGDGRVSGGRAWVLPGQRASSGEHGDGGADRGAVFGATGGSATSGPRGEGPEASRGGSRGGETSSRDTSRSRGRRAAVGGDWNNGRICRPSALLFHRGVLAEARSMSAGRLERRPHREAEAPQLQPDLEVPSGWPESPSAGVRDRHHPRAAVRLGPMWP
jgi:hypothetical protein